MKKINLKNFKKYKKDVHIDIFSKLRNNLFIGEEATPNLGVVCSMKNDKGVRLLGDHQEVAHRPELGEHGKQVRLKQERFYSARISIIK
jgi:hypothetical protein